VVDARTREIKEAQVFVAVQGASNYTYAEASWSQDLESWISCHTHAFSFFGGVTRITVPDNLGSGVTKACRYEPDLNPTYQDYVVYPLMLRKRQKCSEINDFSSLDAT
jgi:transposase